MVTYHTKCKYIIYIICFLVDFMDSSYTKQNVNTTQHDHNYFITADAEGLMNENH